jgi:uncharacterized membrane protein
MLQKTSSHRNILARCLAAMALIGVYCVSIVGTSALFLAASTSSADAQRGRGRGGGGGRGYGYGRGRGGGYYGGRGRGYGFGPAIVVPRIVGPGCYYSRRYGRTICPY